MNKPISKPLPMNPITVTIAGSSIHIHCINRQYWEKMKPIAAEFGPTYYMSGDIEQDNTPVFWRLSVSINYSVFDVCSYLQGVAKNIDKVDVPQPIADVLIEFQHKDIPSARSIDIYCTSLQVWNSVAPNFTPYGEIVFLKGDGPGRVRVMLNVSKHFTTDSVWKYLTSLFPQVPEKTKAK